MAYAVILHCSAEKYVKEHNLEDDLGLLAEYQVPLRQGTVTHVIVNWTDFPIDPLEAISMVESFYGSVSGSTRTYVDNTRAYTKYLLKLEGAGQ